MKLVVLIALLCGLAAAADTPETVMITYQAKSGADAELARAIEKHWTTARQLKLALEPHLTLRGVEDDGRVYFVDIFTWRDEKIPDSAPAAIQAIWAEMNGVVETRGGKPGIQIQRVAVVAR
jgi:hypothetical protein